jgi:hypothetical protein
MIEDGGEKRWLEGNMAQSPCGAWAVSNFQADELRITPLTTPTLDVNNAVSACPASPDSPVQ